MKSLYRKPRKRGGRIHGSDQTWGGTQLTPPVQRKAPSLFSQALREWKCSGGCLSPWQWCVSEAFAAALWGLMWWADWLYPGTTGWNCVGESSSEPSFSPAAAPGGNDPQTWVSRRCCTDIQCSMCGTVTWTGILKRDKKYIYIYSHRQLCSFLQYIFCLSVLVNMWSLLK